MEVGQNRGEDTRFCLAKRFRVVACEANQEPCDGVARDLRIRLPDPVRERRHVAHTFVHGSSGPFGEEIPGEWLTIEAVLEKYRGIDAQYRLFGDFGWFTTGPLRRVQTKTASVLGLLPGWYDTHAKHGSACVAGPSHGAR